MIKRCQCWENESSDEVGGVSCGGEAVAAVMGSVE